MKKLAEDIVKYAKQKGASEAQVSINDETEFWVEVRNQNIEKLQQANSKNLSLKIIVNEKVANASSSDFSLDTLHKLVENAVERAKLASPDTFSSLPENQPITVNEKDLQIYDPSIEKISADDKINIAKRIEKIALSDKRITVSGGSSYYTAIGNVVIANSKGFTGTYKYSSVSAGVSLQAGNKDNPVEDYWYESAKYLNGISSPEKIAGTAIDRVTRLIGSKKVKTQRVPVVFDRKMASSLLGFLSQCINGHSVYMKRSFLAGKIGSKVAASNIKLIDNGLLPKGLGTSPFDSEGVPSQKTTLIENGILKNYILDTYSARKLNLKSTGNAGGSSNLYIETGNYSPEEIIASVNNGLFFVRSLGQGTNSTTGDYSKGCYGIWIENGKLAYPVSEITVSGNLSDMLNNIEMLGNDLVFDSSITSPTLKIKELTISGV